MLSEVRQFFSEKLKIRAPKFMVELSNAILGPQIWGREVGLLALDRLVVFILSSA